MDYTLAFDLKAHSVGVAAVERGSDGLPARILYAESVIHRGGAQTKEGKSRKAVAGELRRAGNKLTHQKHYREKLYTVLREEGFVDPRSVPNSQPGDPTLEFGDVYDLRAAMVEQRLDGKTLTAAISRVAAHIFKHRGSRNPWKSIDFVKATAMAGYSAEYDEFVERIQRRYHADVPEGLTPSQLVVLVRALDDSKDAPAVKSFHREIFEFPGVTDPEKVAELAKAKVADAEKVHAAHGTAVSANDLKRARSRMRHTLARLTDAEASEPIKGGALCRSDYIREWYQICEMQHIPKAKAERIASALIIQKHPGAAADNLAKRCPVNRGERAGRMRGLAYQEYRIASVLGAVQASGKPLTVKKRQAMFAILNNWTAAEPPSWADLIELVPGKHLTGFEELRRPPYNKTHQTIVKTFTAKKALAPVANWWLSADRADRDAFIAIIDNAGSGGEASAAGAVQRFLDTLTGPQLEALGNLTFRGDEGRAPYGETALKALTSKILAEPVAEDAAFLKLFGKSPVVSPVSKNLGELVGNPVVDTILRIVQSLHDKIVSQYGSPTSIVVGTELGLGSSQETLSKRRSTNNRLQKARAALGGGTRVRTNRLMIYTRQGGVCLYCGNSLGSVSTMEVDHIIPQSKGGSSSMPNLAGACRTCNRSKGTSSFVDWAGGRTSKRYVSTMDRVSKLRPLVGKSRDFSFIKAQSDRLKLREEPAQATGSRSWVAKELRQRLEYLHRDPGVKVLTPNEYVVADACSLGGFNYFPSMLRFPEEGTVSKSSSDRRQYAVDAIVMTSLSHPVLKIMDARNQLRQAAGFVEDTSWRDYEGADESQRQEFHQWQASVAQLRELTESALATDSVGVRSIARRKLDTLQAGQYRVRPWHYKKVSDAYSKDDLASVAEADVWKLLIKDRKFDKAKQTLPANPKRKLRNGMGPSDSVKVFGSPAGGLIKGTGYVNSGQGFIHHMRVYKVAGRRVGLAVLAHELKTNSPKGVDYGRVPLDPSGSSRRRRGLGVVDLPRMPEYTVQRGEIIELSREQLWAKNKKGKYEFASKPFSLGRQLEEETGVQLPTYRWVVTGFNQAGYLLLRLLVLGELPAGSSAARKRLVCTDAPMLAGLLPKARGLE